jgi:hypothetical protein
MLCRETVALDKIIWRQKRHCHHAHRLAVGRGAASGYTDADGLTAVADSLLNLLFGLVAGVWVDRVRRRPLLVGADLGRVLLLGSILLAAWFGYISYAQLWIAPCTW